MVPNPLLCPGIPIIIVHCHRKLNFAFPTNTIQYSFIFHLKENVLLTNLFLIIFFSSVSIEGKYLRFNAIAPAAAGRYYCSASNRFGNTTEMAEVIVNRGHIYEEASPAKTYQLNEGESVHIACDIAPHKIPLRGEVYVSTAILS